MTHEELLNKVQKTIDSYINFDHGRVQPDFLNSLQALRAVVELHKPSNFDYRMCFYCPHEYPCPTILVIVKELE